MIAWPGGGDGDASGDAVGNDRSTLGPDGVRQQVEQARQAFFGWMVGGEDIEGASQEASFAMSGAVSLAAGPRPAFDEQWRRWNGWCGDRQTLRDTVIHLVSIVPRPVRAGIPPNGVGAAGRRYRRTRGQPGGRAVSRGGRWRSEPGGRGSCARRR